MTVPRSVLVIGATGLLGTHTCEAFLRGGWRTRGLVRSSGRLPIGVEEVHADLGEDLDWRRLLAGHDVAVMAAGVVPPASRYGPGRALAAHIHERIIDGLVRAGVHRLILIASAPAPSTGVMPATEDTPLSAIGDLCADVLLDAERVAWAAHARGPMEVVVIRPTTCYGVGDRSFLPRVAADLIAGRSALVGGGLTPASLCHAGHVGAICVRAAQAQAAAGLAFHVRDRELLSWKAVLTRVAAWLEVPPPRRRIPVILARPASHVLAAASRLLGASGAPLLSPHVLDLLTGATPVSIDRAREVLDFSPPLSTAAGLDLTLAKTRPSAAPERTYQEVWPT